MSGLGSLVGELIGHRLGLNDLVLAGETGRNEILILIFREADEVEFYKRELPELRTALGGGARQPRRPRRLSLPEAGARPAHRDRRVAAQSDHRRGDAGAGRARGSPQRGGAERAPRGPPPPPPALRAGAGRARHLRLRADRRRRHAHRVRLRGARARPGGLRAALAGGPVRDGDARRTCSSSSTASAGRARSTARAICRAARSSS